jgi:hypothetical protein
LSHTARQQVLFASEIKALFAYPNVPREMIAVDRLYILDDAESANDVHKFLSCRPATR